MKVKMKIGLYLTCFLLYTEACDWSLVSKPAIFGQTVKLSCVFEIGTANDSTPTWLGGPNYTLLAIYDKSSAHNKYKVRNHINNTQFESVLEIFNFSEQDVNCDYSCSHGFNEIRKKLKLTTNDFERHPRADEISILSVFRDGNLDVQLEIRRVFPTPKCTVLFNKKPIVNRIDMNIDVNGLFYSMSETLHHNFGSSACQGRLQITCIVGQTNIEIQDKYFDTCKVSLHPTTSAKDSKTNNVSATSITVYGSIGLVAVLSGICVISLIVFGKYKTLKNVVCCNVSWRGEDRTKLVADMLKEYKFKQLSAEREANQTDIMNESLI